jgi:hypothetical protein
MGPKMRRMKMTMTTPWKREEIFYRPELEEAP